MADLLTHVLVAYSLTTALSFRYEWLTPHYVTVAMIGSILPDLSRMSLLVAGERIELLTGLPFSWFGFHTLGGVLLTSAIGALLTSGEWRRRVFGLLVFGALSHLVLDALLLAPSGYSAPMWVPFTTQRLPTPGLYQSPDRWPALLAASVATVAWYLRHRTSFGTGVSTSQ